MEIEQLTLFNLGVNMARLKARAAELAGQATAQATVRAYDADWRSFSGFCGAAGRQALPASPDTIMLYAVSELQTRTPSTVERRLAAITGMHVAQGLAKPDLGEVRQVLIGWKREHGSRERSKTALTPGHLRSMLKTLPTDGGGFRDCALLTLGFATGLRRSDLARLNLADVVVSGAGVKVFIRRGKTDQLGKGREIFVMAGKHQATDPVRAMERYLKSRGAWAGALFVRLERGRRDLSRLRLGAESMADLVQRCAAAIGLDAADFGAHSLRAGCVTTALEMGVPESLVMKVTGHRSHATLLKYARPARLSLDVLSRAV